RAGGRQSERSWMTGSAGAERGRDPSAWSGASGPPPQRPYASTWLKVPDGSSSPEDEDPPIEDGRRNPAAGSGHSRPLLSAIGRRIVSLIRCKIARVAAVDAAADRVQPSL